MLDADEIQATDAGDDAARRAIAGPITLGFPARPEPVRLARLVGAAVAGSVDVSLDDIEDLRIAVGEACTMLVGHATPSARVEITIEPRAEAIDFSAQLRGGLRPDPQVDDLAQLVLRSLADDVDFRLDADEAALTFSWPIAGAASSGSPSVE